MSDAVHLELERIWWLGGMYVGTVALLNCGIRAARAHKARREEEQSTFLQHLNCEHRESVDRTEREEEGFLGNTVIFPHCDLDEIFYHAPGGHMLKYNADRSLSFTVIFMFKNTLLCNTQILNHMRICVVVSAVTSFIHIGLRAFADVEPMQRNWLEDANKMCSFLTSLIGVLLGFYISTVMTRWWSMRSDGIGGMWGAVNDLCVLTGSFFPGPEWRKLRTLILRYGLVSFELTFMENEDQDEDLDALMQRHLLTSDEAACLAGNPSKGMAVWTWVGWIFRELQKQGHLSDVTLRLFLDKVLQARGSAGALLTLLCCQLPFLYMQLLSQLVHFLTILMAADCGMASGACLISHDIGSPILKFVQMLMVTYFYNGCLEIGRSFANPCKQDFSDFPRYAYHFGLRNEAEFFHSVTEKPPLAGIQLLGEAASRT